MDAKGTFLAGVGAGPVYQLLGKRSLGATEFPPIETPLVEGEIAFRQHGDGHTDAPNWPTFLAFASRYLTPCRFRRRRPDPMRNQPRCFSSEPCPRKPGRSCRERTRPGKGDRAVRQAGH